MAFTTSIDVCGAALTRRQFVKAGGALIVGVGLVGPELLKSATAAAAQEAVGKHSLDPSLPGSWFEIHADNTMIIRTGSCDFGQSSTTVSFRQIVADELNFPYDSITQVVEGDTDRTPDGSVSAGFLHRGGLNLRKAAAYTQQALIDLAAIKLSVDKTTLTAKDGVVSGGGKSITYGQLVAGQELTLRIPVTGDLTAMQGLRVAGDPPMKPTSQYTVIGKSFKNPVTAAKVKGEKIWITDVRLPGMLHGRVIHPKTIGSTLVSAGTVDKNRFPNAQVIVKGSLVGVVAPTEWEAIGAAQQVSTGTTWTDWKGLPGHTNLPSWLRERADWKTAPVTKGRRNQGDPEVALADAAKKLSVSYDLPFIKHAPIGPAVAVADVKSDGTTFVYAHTQNPSYLRRQIAMMLATSIDNVVVRAFAGTAHYGRSNGGNAGAEDEAVLLSQATGHPVRVHWTRADDMMWSTTSSPAYSDVRMALDAQGNIVGAQLDHYMPVMQDDRPIGAVLAGLPTMKAPDVEGNSYGLGSIVNGISDPWLYDRVPNLTELGHGTFNVGQKETPMETGLRDHTFRTPGQMHQNYPRELAISEAAALAGVDAIEYRLRHTTDERLISVLKSVRESSGWQTRAAPATKAVSTGSTPVSGQGVAVMLRGGTYWACACEVSVNPATGKVKVDKYSIAVDPGIVMNPLQLKRQIQGGGMMGIGHALYEEMRFDESGVTSRDWRTYPIATMADVPEMNVMIVAKPEVGAYGDGSEAANALAMPAIAAAFFDATGKMPRRLPLTPSYVQSVLKA